MVATLGPGDGHTESSMNTTTKKVRGSRTGRPIMTLLDLLGRRWALRILWELREEGATFRVLRERCGDPSPSVLNDRLAELREIGIVESPEEGGYVLSASGRSLLPMLAALDAWSKKHL